MTGVIVFNKVYALVYVILSKAEILMSYGELCCTTECITLYMRCHTNQG